MLILIMLQRYELNPTSKNRKKNKKCHQKSGLTNPMSKKSYKIALYEWPLGLSVSQLKTKN